MTKQITERDRQSHELSGRQPYPAFKPVALPALAAAVQAANPRPTPPRTPPRQHELPAILRKEAMTD